MSITELRFISLTPPKFIQGPKSAKVGPIFACEALWFRNEATYLNFKTSIESANESAILSPKIILVGLPTLRIKRYRITHMKHGPENCV